MQPMAKYLDSTGLTHLWEKLLGTFALQSRLIDTILQTAEDGFYITDYNGNVGYSIKVDAQNNVIVKSNNDTFWVGTQVEYSQLTTAQKEAIIAFITE